MITKPKIISAFTDNYHFLSNFSNSPNTPPTLEHWFQAFKSSDPFKILDALELNTPGRAKHFGRGVELRLDWDEIKIPLMRRLVTKKFADGMLHNRLTATDNAELIEGNYWHDNFWGACICAKCFKKEKHNWLGRVLMDERTALSGISYDLQFEYPIVEAIKLVPGPEEMI